MSAGRWPVVAGIPLRGAARENVATRHWLPDGWTDREPYDAPLEIAYTVGSTSRESRRLLLGSERSDSGELLLDAAGEIAVRATDTTDEPAQLMVTVRPGYRYEVRYEREPLIPRWQWRWPRNVFGYALASRRRGVIAHACGLRLAGGMGVLVPGCSGDGKSTFGRTLASESDLGVTALSDDRVAIISGEDGRLRIAGTPWHSSAHLSSSAEADLSLIAFPARGDRVPRLRSVSRNEAARRLMRCLGYPVWSRELMLWALDLTSRIVAATPAVEIAYAPGPEAPRALHVHLCSAVEDVHA